jgi:cytosine/adenosine deaminase-related metal-dependent hydrolase
MFLSAPLIHNGYQFLPEGSVIEIADDGTIVAIHNGLQGEYVIQHKGLLCPGFVNVHCHLELSHLKDMLPEKTGLIPFLQKIPLYRTEFTDEQIKAARHEAYHELLANGVVAVGDIANVEDTLDLRQLDKLHVHTFIECIGFTEIHAQERFDESAIIYKSFAGQDHAGKMLRQSIVPHAPYSVAPSVFAMIDTHNPAAIISIHNQESVAENEYYQNKTGAVNDLLGSFGINDAFFSPSGKTSLRTYANWLSSQHPIIFVHNTYTSIEDVQVATHRFKQSFWCLCPNANLYIEDKLPDVKMLQDADVTICIGTDSLASNHQLSVLSELYTLKEHFPALDWEDLLQWGTINGAKALDMQHLIGSIEAGKQPGIVNITQMQSKPVVRRVV